MPVVYGHAALSPEARAAKGEVGIAEDRRWIIIQLSTFRNWVNEQLSRGAEVLGPGGRAALSVEDVGRDLADGVALIGLVEVLQRRRCTGRVYDHNPSEIQMLTNVQLALDAMQDDGVKLVNIGAYDIVEGNVKLILGLLWCLILRYQIAGKTKIPPKKLMLAWIQAAIPECDIRNFKTDWNNGLALCALVDYCLPGSFPEWRSFNSSRREENCRRAMEVALRELGIPMILSPEDMASPNLDELSAMTYLSYFLKHSAPGYNATLARVNHLMQDVRVNDFTKDWQDGLVLCQLVANLGGQIPGWPNLSMDPQHWAKNLNLGLSGARQLGVEPILTAHEIIENEVDHLPVMAYAARFCSLKPGGRGLPVQQSVQRPRAPPQPALPPQAPREQRRPMLPRDMARIQAPSVHKFHPHGQINIEVSILEAGLEVGDLEAVVTGPEGYRIPSNLRRSHHGANVSFIPIDVGTYKVRVLCSGGEVGGSPLEVGVTTEPRVSQANAAPLHTSQLRSPMETEGRNSVSFSGLTEPCAVGSIVEVVLNAQRTSKAGSVDVEAKAPSGRITKCQVGQRHSTYTATFTPNEVGEWSIGIVYDGEDIRGSPFTCFVYDPNLVQVYGMDVGVVGQEIKFNVNTTHAGEGKIKVKSLHNGRSIPCHIEDQGQGLHKVQFTPDGAGQYKIHVFFNNMEVKGSPFILDIVDASSVSVYGENLRVGSVDKLATFMIHAVGADAKDLTVLITVKSDEPMGMTILDPPSGGTTSGRVFAVGDNAFQAEWQPFEAGEHAIEVRLGDALVDGSPVACNVGDSARISVSGIPDQLALSDLGSPISFQIDARAGGSGNLEIMINGGSVGCTVAEAGPRRYVATFVPVQPALHLIELKFNGDPVKGSPWRLEPVPADQSVTTHAPAFILAPARLAPLGVSSRRSMVEANGWVDLEGLGLSKAVLGSRSSFSLTSTADLPSVEGYLSGASGTRVPVSVVPGRRGATCSYVAAEVGTAQLHLSIGGKRVEGSPFAVSVFAPHLVRIQPVPGGAVGEPVRFVVDAAAAGRGQMEISVNQGRVPNSVEMEGPGRCLVTFIPAAAGTYVVDVTFNGELVKGCPARVLVHEATTNKLTSFSLASGGLSDSTSNRYVHNDGSGSYMETTTSSTTSKTIGGSGGHYDNVTSFDQLRSNALPARDAYSKLHTASELSPGRSSGMTVERSSYVSSGGEFRPEYKSFESLSPREPPKDYDSSIKSAALLPKSKTTRTVEVEENVTETVTKIITRRGKDGKEYQVREESTVAHEPKSTSQQLSPAAAKTTIVKTTILQPTAETPKSYGLIASRRQGSIDATLNPPRVEQYEEAPRGDEETLVDRETTWAAPTETIPSPPRSVEREVMEVTRMSNSPPPPPPPHAGGALESLDLSAVRLSGPGLGPVRLGRAAHVTLSPLSGDAELLRVSVLSPSRAQLRHRLSSTADGFRLDFTPDEIGTHQIRVSSGSSAVEGQFKVFEPAHILVSPIYDGVVGEPVFFTIDAASAGYGNLEIAILDAGDAIIPSNVAPLRDGTTGVAQRSAYHVSFHPEAPGRYTVNIKFNDENLKESPYSCLIREVKAVKTQGRVEVVTAAVVASAVSRDSEEEQYATVADSPPPPPPLPEKEALLSRARVEMMTTVDEDQSSHCAVGKTAALVLKAQADGPVTAIVTDASGEHLPAKIVDTGSSTYRVEFVPQIVGDHTISVRFADVDVAKSPFNCRVYDARNIKVGHIPTGTLGKPVHFVVDASEAGVGNLEVAVNEGRIPSMAHSLGHHRYDISFVPKEPEAHSISIRFNNEAVPGSPFDCQILGVGEAAAASSAAGPGLERVPVGRLSHFYVEGPAHRPNVSISDPTGADVKATIETDSGDVGGAWKVGWKPLIVGNHVIAISSGEDDIPGSPFTAKAFDAAKVKLQPVEGGVLGQESHFTIDAAKAGAGNMEIIVSVDGRNVPNYVKAEGNAKFRVSFTPKEPHSHTVSVKFNGDSVPGSPMTCGISDGSECVASGDGLRIAAVNKTAWFVVDPRSTNSQDCNVVITGPSRKDVNLQVKKKEQENSNDVFEVNYIPTEIGPHKISVEYGGQTVSGSPFVANVFDPDKIQLSRLGPGFVNRAVKFTVDSSGAGEGDLEVEVRSNRGANVPPSYDNAERSLTHVSFLPLESAPYWVMIRFNGVLVGGEARRVEVVEAGGGCAVFGDGLRRAEVEQPASFLLELARAGLEEEIAVRVTGPDGRVLPCALRSESEKTVRGEWVPLEPGPHRLEVTFAGAHAPGSPFTAAAFDLSRVRLQGLADGQVGKEQSFVVDHSAAGSGDVSVEIEGGGRSLRPNLSHNESKGTASVSFTPHTPGLHKLDVSFNGILLPECPYEVAVREAGAGARAFGPGLESTSVGAPASFTVRAEKSAGRAELDVLVLAADGSAVPVKCFQTKDGHYRVEYEASQVGSQRVEVAFGDKAVPGSPFAVDVFDPRRVRLEPDFRRCLRSQEASLGVSRAGAGAAELGLEVRAADGAVVPHEVLRLSSTEDEVRFFPNTLGTHTLTATYGGFQVPGCPMRFVVEEAGKVAAYGDGLVRALVNREAKFTIDAKKNKGGLKVDIHGPSGKVKHATSKKGDGVLLITYTPTEVGIYDIAIIWNNNAVSGSPFSALVVDPSKVRLGASTLDSRGEIPYVVGQTKAIAVDAVGAGPGELSGELQSPSGTTLEVAAEELSGAQWRLTTTAREEGEQDLALLWSGFPIPPIRGYAEFTLQRFEEAKLVAAAAPKGEPLEHDDGLNVILRGEGLKVAHMREEAEFIIDGSEAARGEPEAVLLGSKADIPVRLTHLGNAVWRANYTPLVSGAYKLEVVWAGREHKDSPFDVDVLSVGDASKVVVDTSALKMGIVDQELKTDIDTSRAGPGTLLAQCVGPQATAYCELYDHKDGTYTLCVRPSEAGKHSLVIKYSDEHVPGSPYTLYISHPPDASKVRVSGPGIDHGILSRFKSNFLVETKGAGAGQLTVRVRGPKGAFNVEMQRERKNDRTIHCKYEPKEPGDYQLEVKWAGEHVPGSPFMVMIFDTHSELERYSSGAPPSPGPPMPFLPPGWVGPPPPPGMFGPPPPGMPPMGMLPPPPGPLPLPPPPHFNGTLPHPRQLPPPPGMQPYASSTLYSNSSSKHGKFIAQNGY